MSVADASGGVATLSQRLDRAPVTTLHWKVWALAAMGVFLDGFDFFIIGVALPLIDAQWDLAGWEQGLVASAAVIGAVVGALTLGRLTDRFGRKSIFLIDLVIFIVFSLASALAWDVWSLAAFRFLLGAGIGADYPISASYVAEVVPSRVRGRFLIGAFSFQAVGMLTGALVGVVLLQLVDDLGTWRWMLAAGVVPALVSAVMRVSIPESPRWLLTHDRASEAADVTEALTGEHVPEVELLAEAQAEEARQAAEPAVRWRDLFRRYRRRTILSTVPWFCMDVATYGVGLFTPTILATILVTSTDGPVATDLASAEGSAFLDLFLVVGFGLAILLVDRVGRIRLQLNGFAVMAVSLCLLALADGLPGGGNDHLALVFVGFVAFNLFMNMGPNATTYTIPAEVFPTELRASGHGLAAAAGKLGATMGTFLFPVLNDDLGTSTTLLIVAGFAAVGFVVTRAFKVETKGQTLEQLEESALASAR